MKISRFCLLASLLAFPVPVSALTPADSPVGQAALKIEPQLVTLAPEPEQPAPHQISQPRANEEVVGDGIQNYLVKGPETLMELARAYGLGFNEVVLANPNVDEWSPPKDSVLKLGTLWVLPEAILHTNNLVVNIPEMRLYHRFNNGKSLETFPVGVGREGWETPTLTATIVAKKADPTWYVPKSILKEKPNLPPQVPPGPENPLGTHAIYLGGVDYRIHGTNQPLGVGRRVSHGCMRLYPEDIIRLYNTVQVGGRVQLVNEPVKAGWRGDWLYLEVHPSLEGDENLRALAVKAIQKAMERQPEWVIYPDWRLVDQWVKTADGMPHQVGGPVRNAKAEETGSSALRDFPALPASSALERKISPAAP